MGLWDTNGPLNRSQKTRPSSCKPEEMFLPTDITVSANHKINRMNHKMKISAVTAILIVIVTTRIAPKKFRKTCWRNYRSMRELKPTGQEHCWNQLEMLNWFLEKWGDIVSIEPQLKIISYNWFEYTSE